MDAKAERAAAGHVPVRTYVLVGLFLAAMTALEVAVPYVGFLRPMMVPLLLVLGAIKFGTVGAYFMHLKFDPRVLTWVFVPGLALGVLVVVAMVIVMAA